MTCSQVNERATDYMERKLSIAGRLAVRAHVARCRDCRAFLRQMRLTVSVLHGVGAEPVPEATRASLLEMFRAVPAPSVAPAVAETSARRLSARMLSGLDRLLGGPKSLIALALLVLGSLGLAAAVRAVPGQALPLSAGLMCGGMEMLAGMLPLGIVTALAWRGRRPSSWAAYAIPAGLGALVGQSMLHFTCPEQGMYVHLGFHVAGVMAAIALGWVASLGQAAWAGRRLMSGRA
jgi:hypothetical protein